MFRHPLLFFTHVLKAGGTSVEAALREALGLRHMAVDPPVGWIYTIEDLRFDRRLNPWASSYSSHWLRPFVDFGEYEPRIAWHTMLREPVARYRSHRQHHVERFGNRDSFEKWSDDPVLRNWQTRQIAGEEDLPAARQILEEKYQFVGLLERFDESMVLMRSRLGLPKLPVDPGTIHNQARSQAMKERIREEMARHSDRVAQLNSLDVELYRWVADTLFPRQVEQYGADRLAEDIRTDRSGSRSTADRLRAHAHLAYRKAIQLPVQRYRARAARRGGRPDIRR